jgi:hypothetical protein
MAGRAQGTTSLVQPADDGLLHLWAVSRAVTSVRNNNPDLLDRIDDPPCAAAKRCASGRPSLVMRLATCVM